MENILDIYEKDYDPDFPQVCIDERPCQLIGDVMQPIAMFPGKTAKQHYEYERHGTCCLFMAVEPLAGFRYIEVRDQRTKRDYAEFLQNLETFYSETQKITLIQDNLNTHDPSSFYKAFSAKEAHRLTQRFQMHYTPKKASWLNMAEIELSAFGKQCLNRRIADQEILTKECQALAKERNEKKVKIHWRFTKNHAREKFEKHYNN